MPPSRNNARIGAVETTGTFAELPSASFPTPFAPTHASSNATRIGRG
jgi:hypothetical protein